MLLERRVRHTTRRLPEASGHAGSNTGPGGTGRAVRISGFEQWTIGDDGLIAASLGSYDQADWDRQINGDTEV